MKKRIKSSFIAILLVLCLSLCSCGNNAEKNKDTVSISNETSVSVSTEASTESSVIEKEDTSVVEVSKYPLVVTDQMGRSVEIKENPAKIVSGYYISSSALMALGVSDRIVGIEAKANKRAIYKLSNAKLIELPSVGSAKEFDIEACAATNPDVVILPMKAKNNIETLENLGLTVVVVNPESKAELVEMIQLLGKITDSEDEAEELLAFMDNALSKLNDKVSAERKVPVYLAGNSDFLSTAPAGMYQSDMVSLAGGLNLAGEIEDNYWVNVSYEQILTWNPEFIIIAADANYSVEDVLNDSAIAQCEAVINKQVYKLPSKAEAWDSPVPACVLGSVWLGGIIHSEVIDEAFVNDMIEEFYEKFYGFSYSKN